jgi:DNA-3-methyladenine glycosylase
LGPVLPVGFYDRPTEIVARDMLGAIMEARSPDGVTRARIVETEAYLGPHDAACHAAAGRTRRTEHLFGPPGRAYVYFIYGMYWCFNAVTRESGHGSAVLVRAAAPLDGLELMRRRRPAAKRDCDLTNGPGKLCNAMAIVGNMSGESLQKGSVVIRAGDDIDDKDVVITPRIGITKAAEWPLRFFVRDDPCVSVTPRDFERRAYERSAP